MRGNVLAPVRELNLFFYFIDKYSFLYFFFFTDFVIVIVGVFSLMCKVQHCDLSDVIASYIDNIIVCVCIDVERFYEFDDNS